VKPRQKKTSIHITTHHDTEFTPRDDLLQSHMAAAHKDHNGNEDAADDDDEDDGAYISIISILCTRMCLQLNFALLCL